MPSLHFKGKAFVQHYHLVVPFHELTLVKSKKGPNAKAPELACELKFGTVNQR